MMKLLILGHSGVIGSNLLDFFLEKNIITYGVSRSSTTNNTDIDPLDFRYSDSVKSLKSFIHSQQISHVVNCVGDPGPDSCEVNQERGFELNTLVVHHIIEAIKNSGVNLIHLSSIYSYGFLPGPYAEDDATLPVNYYGVTKVIAEKLIKDRLGQFLIVRLPLMVGVGSHPMDYFTKIQKMALESSSSQLEIPFNKEIKYPTSIRKLGELLLKAIEEKYHGDINFSSPHGYTSMDLLKKYMDFLGQAIELSYREDTRPAKRVEDLKLISNLDFVKNFQHATLEEIFQASRGKSA